MSLNIPVSLENNTSYHNTGSFFSKSILLKQNYKNIGNSLLITSENKNIEKYRKILNYLQINISKIEYEHDVVNLFFNKVGFYTMTPEQYDIELENTHQIKHHSLDMHINMEVSQEEILEKLGILGYKFSDFRSPGTYKKSGDILSIVSPCGIYHYNISFWGESIDSLEISEIFADLIRNTRPCKKLWIGANNEIGVAKRKKDQKLGDLIEQSDVCIVADQINFSHCYESIFSNAKNIISFDIIKNEFVESQNANIFTPKIKNLDDLKEILISGKQIHIYTKNYDTIDNFIQYNNISGVTLNKVKISHLESFKIDNTIVICDDILSSVFIKKRIKKNFSADMDLLMKITPGDYVVHIDHGIGKFNGIIKKSIGNIAKEYIEIEYRGEEKLFVPIMEVGRVSKYVGVENPKLTGLGGTAWEKSLKSASQDATKVAAELLEIYSKRKHCKGFSFVYDTSKQAEFINSFEYIYTEDQQTAVEEILEEMTHPEPMDRLLIGDVGFGKTEIAFNAIYNAYTNGKQSVLITPLVVLAYEHYEKAIERFKDFGLKIDILTRFESDKKAKNTLAKLSQGELDLVIGTHRLLSDKVIYKSLGLLVIDEEHKFGVSDKEKIKKYKTHIDVLTMSATPIPRSLNMALSSIRTMSTLKHPPSGRKHIDTSVIKFNENLIAQACQKEFDRGGQVFFIHNRVANIEHMKKLLLSLFPEKKIIIAHGQLSGDALEKAIIDFKDKKYDVLLSTTVIENGIDFPNVNTIFINDAYRFGISQIHQLRGRVGRSDKKGYCYLLFKHENMNPDSAKRLQTIVEYSYLGAGFELAMKDLEIRGGGDLLGTSQSGQKTDIGVNLFLKMVEEKVETMKQEIDNPNPSSSSSTLAEEEKIRLAPRCNIDLNLEVALPDKLFATPLDKINFYREVETINNIGDLQFMAGDFMDNPDVATINFFGLLKAKLLGQKYFISNIKKLGIHYQVDFYKNDSLENIARFLENDSRSHFSVTDKSRIRTPIKNFENSQEFLQYLLLLFEKKVSHSKIKIKKKA